MDKKSNRRSILSMKIAKFGYILLSVTLCALGVIRIKMSLFSTEKSVYFAASCLLHLDVFG